MDLARAIVAKSDQLNADDLIAGPRTFTIAEVREGSDEQPASIFLVEWPGRPFKPSKTVMRILSYVWGSTQTDDWPQGARLTLFRDPDVKWAGVAVGGIRVSHVSHIKEPMKIALAESKTKKSLHTVLPLKDQPAAKPAPAEPTAEEVAACTDLAALKTLWDRAVSDERKAQIAQRKADIENDPTGDDQ